MHCTWRVACALTVQLEFAVTVTVAVVPLTVTPQWPPVTPPPWLTIVHVAEATEDPLGQTGPTEYAFDDPKQFGPLLNT
jgi:hypothetical protein